MIKKEVISLEAQWYGGGYKFIMFENNIGIFAFEYGSHNKVDLDESKIIKFWQEVDELNIWNWKKKYPYWKQKYEPMLDGCSWELKIRNRKQKAKYSKGYESYPRTYKKLISILIKLFDAEEFEKDIIY